MTFPAFRRHGVLQIACSFFASLLVASAARKIPGRRFFVARRDSLRD